MSFCQNREVLSNTETTGETYSRRSLHILFRWGLLFTTNFSTPVWLFRSQRGRGLIPMAVMHASEEGKTLDMPFCLQFLLTSSRQPLICMYIALQGHQTLDERRRLRASHWCSESPCFPRLEVPKYVLWWVTDRGATESVNMRLLFSLLLNKDFRTREKFTILVWIHVIPL